ncbi:MAG: DUF4382 domain-containing protein [Marinilabiliaceae bacterium]|jgi:hypothetical protein|nr:DUF4382 domain-containing protein [Marinilabiliaceae bacterium]
MKRLLFFAGLIAAVVLTVGSCSKDLKTESGNGILKISVTDAPFPVEFIEEAKVQIIKVEARLKDYDEGYPFITLLEDTLEFNLLDLRNGVTAELAEMEVPAGDYDLIRLYVESAGITVKDHGSYEMKVPSGAQTGIKIFVDPAITVAGGLTSDLLLDFDLKESFILKGNISSPAGIKGFNFKPVIRAANMSFSGSVNGMVTDTSDVLIPVAEVWIKADTVIATALSDSSGYYALPGIPEGSYTIFAAKENYDTLSIDNVRVVAGNNTKVDIELIPKN